MTRALTLSRARICGLVLAASVAALLGISSQGRAGDWLGELLLSSRAEASVPSNAGIAIRLPPAMPADLVAVAVQPTTALVSSPDEARLVNASLPFSGTAIEAARPFHLTGYSSGGDRALQCMTQAVYYEAGFEPLEGRRAVAQVVLNRMRHPAYPNSVCGVIYQGSTAPGCQFSFTCDGSLARPPARKAWDEAAAVAREALGGRVASAVGQATHYHTDYVAPYWAPRLSKIVQIGAHIFYRWPGNWGRRQAFTSAYAGEPAFSASPAATASLDAGAVPAAAASTLPEDPRDRRTISDVGGRLDVSKGWTLSIPLPVETRNALSGILTSQEKAAESVATAAIGQSQSGQSPSGQSPSGQSPSSPSSGGR
jgi:spore germination cell wall hydrolase CwlJ-like protein